MNSLCSFSHGIHSRLLNGSHSILSTFIQQQPIFKRYLYRKELYAAYLNMDIEKVGRRGDIVLLKPGFARNFIVGTNKGFIIPQDPRHFKKHQAIYKALGYPTDLILQYYNGEVEALPKGGSLPSSSNVNENEFSVKASTEALFGKKPPTTMEIIQVRQQIFNTIQSLIPQLNYALPSNQSLNVSLVYEFIKSKTALPHQWTLTLPFVNQFHFFTLDGKTTLQSITDMGQYRLSIHARFVGWLHLPLLVTKNTTSTTLGGSALFEVPAKASIVLPKPIPWSSNVYTNPSSSSSSFSSSSSKTDALKESEVLKQETESA